MAAKYDVTQYGIDSILSYIREGEIAIPEIQRPFVWKGAQVRDLIDSLYNGYPTGYLIIWQNPDVKLKNGETAIGKKVLIDGQQRVTALMTAVAGFKILTEDYVEKVIKIAFNPLAGEEEDKFAVQTPAHIKSPIWISDISEVFKNDFSSAKFLKQYEEDNPEVDIDKVEKAIEQLKSIKSIQLGAILLNAQLDINEVTDIFVRINSKGKILNEADFAMSKIAADKGNGGNMLRKAIDYFCHLAVDPNFYTMLSSSDDDFMRSKFASKIKWLSTVNEDIYDPDYSDMLRTSFMHIFGRAKLGVLVSLLSGRDFEERTFKDSIVKDSFEKLESGIINFINQDNFENFVKAIKGAGFRSSKLLNSKITLDFAYTLYLLLKNDKELKPTEVPHYVQKWFVLTTLTSRYIGSPESVMDRDLRAIKSSDFKKFFEDIEAAQLSDTFWEIGLPQSFHTTSTSSPYFNTFLAAQIFNADKALFSTTDLVQDLILNIGDVHHIFPKAYLIENGIKSKNDYNQVANYTFLDNKTNIAIGKLAPKEYFGKAFAQCDTKELNIGTITDKAVLMNSLEKNAFR